LPVQNVSWCDAVSFANRLSAKQGLTAVYGGVEACESSKSSSVTVNWRANGWRLPTEAEWEYAARAGTSDVWTGTTEESGACRYGNVSNPAAKAKFGWSYASFSCDDGYLAAAPVGRFRANVFGLYDMTGNVWEWTGDWYADTYDTSAAVDPHGSSAGSIRADRGGSWNVVPAYSRLANRSGDTPVNRGGYVGLRLVRAGP